MDLPDEQEVAALARRIVGNNGWLVIDPDQITSRVMEWLRTGVTIKGRYGLQNLCERAAAEQFYALCHAIPALDAPTEQKVRWHLAYQDLGAYLLAVARRSTRQPAQGVQWESVVQDALVTIFERLDAVATPQAFLSFAFVVLEYKRKASGKRRPEPLAPEPRVFDPEADSDDPLASIADQQAEIEMQLIVDLENESEIFEIFDTCLTRWEHRLIAYGIYLNCSPQEIQAKSSKIDYHNQRRAMSKRLTKCGRVQRLLQGDKRRADEICGNNSCPLRVIKRGKS